MNRKTETAILAGGCFWCTEAIFGRLKGVIKVTPGYTGGDKPATYEEVCRGTTGHAEAIRIEFNPQEISYTKILEIFFGTHDPTTPNRQGADTGSQYRSAIFYQNLPQKSTAEKLIAQLEAEGKFKAPIITQVAAAAKFYPAEDYHRNYYENNPDAAYCRLVIDPKIQKLLNDFGSVVKTHAKT